MIKKQSGFTFIELILCMVLSAILAGVVVEIIAGPIRAYFWYTQRNHYVDMAQMSLENIQADLQSSLLSSISLNKQSQGQSLHFRNIVYKGIALPSEQAPTNNLTIHTSLPDNLISIKQNQELFVVFPAMNNAKDKLYRFTMTSKEKGHAITLSEPFSLQHPMPFYIVSSLITYECLPDTHTLERVMVTSPSESQKSLLSNQLSDCQFTLVDGQPQKVLVSLSFGEKKTRVTLAQPITVGIQ